MPPVTATPGPFGMTEVPLILVTAKVSPRTSVSLAVALMVAATPLVVVNVSATATGGASSANASSRPSPIPAPAPGFILTLNVMVVNVPLMRTLPAAEPFAMLEFDCPPADAWPSCSVIVPKVGSTRKCERPDTFVSVAPVVVSVQSELFEVPETPPKRSRCRTGFVTAVLKVIVTVPTSAVLVAFQMVDSDAPPAAVLSKVAAVTPPAALLSVSLNGAVQVDEPALANVTVVVMPSVVLLAVNPATVHAPVLVLASTPA